MWRAGGFLKASFVPNELRLALIAFVRIFPGFSLPNTLARQT
jgi:hypothetical protein